MVLIATPPHYRCQPLIAHNIRTMHIPRGLNIVGDGNMTVASALLISSGLQFLQLLIVVNCKQPYSESLTFFRSSNHLKRVIIVIKL